MNEWDRSLCPRGLVGAGTRGPDETAYRQSLVVPGLQTADTKVSRSRGRQTRGSRGIMRAVERYDPTQGTPFLAWAHTWVRQALQQAIAEQSRPFRLTRHALWDLHEAKSAHEHLWQRHRAEPSLGRLADELGWPQDRVIHVLRAGQTAEHPDALDLVDDPITNDAYEDVITRVTATQVRPLLLALPEREREILDRRANDETLRDVARSLGLSHQRVAVLEERGLSRVRMAAETTSIARPLAARSDT